MQLNGMIQTSVPGIFLMAVFLASFILPAAIGIYLVINFFSSPKRIKGTIPDKMPRTFFAVVVPARNEERVIRDTIRNLRRTEYPAEKYEMIVIADNCSDNTALYARSEGVKVFVRNELAKRSKAHALKWLFSHEEFRTKDYGAICILDADAVLAPDFLHAMDAEIQNGYEIIQGRCGSVNPYDSVPSGFMTVLASVQNRLWYLPQANRDRSGFYIGTGACITMERIRKTGWNIHTLVEDAEFSIQSVLQGGFVRYCDRARYYVEQVTTWKDLWKQQRRWRTGQIDCLKRYAGPILHSVFGKRNKDAVSLLILVLIPVLCVSAILQTILIPILFLVFFDVADASPLLMASGFLVNVAVLFAVYSFVLWMDGVFSFRLWKGILAAIFAPYFYGVVDIVCLIRPKKEWSPILHGHSKWYPDKTNRIQLGLEKHRKLWRLRKMNRRHRRKMRQN